MAYACPVCESLVPDGEHLAHHLAIVAMSRGGEHETWLDDHAPGWRETGPDALAATATEHTEEVEHELADETAGDHPDVDHTHVEHAHDDDTHDNEPQHGRDSVDPTDGRAGGATASDDATAAALAEAREITRRMLDDDGSDDATDSGDSAKTGDSSGSDDATEADDVPESEDASESDGASRTDNDE